MTDGFMNTLCAAAEAGRRAAPVGHEAAANAAFASLPEVGVALQELHAISDIMEMAGCAIDAGTFQPSGDTLTWLAERLRGAAARITNAMDAPGLAASAAIAATPEVAAMLDKAKVDDKG